MEATLSINMESLFTLGFFVVTLIYAVFTIIVVYHWFTYGNDKRLTSLSLTIYLLTSAPLLLLMAISLALM